jgi:hypothetical protein
VAKVLPFPKKARRETIRGAARSALTEAMAAVGDIDGVLVFTVGADGRYAIRAAYTEDRSLFEVYARAAQVIRIAQDGLIVHESE